MILKSCLLFNDILFDLQGDHDKVYQLRMSVLAVLTEGVSDNCHPASYYLNSEKLFLISDDQYCNPERGFKLGTLST